MCCNTAEHCNEQIKEKACLLTRCTWIGGCERAAISLTITKQEIMGGLDLMASTGRKQQVSTHCFNTNCKPNGISLTSGINQDQSEWVLRGCKSDLVRLNVGQMGLAWTVGCVFRLVGASWGELEWMWARSHLIIFVIKRRQLMKTKNYLSTARKQNKTKGCQDFKYLSK